MRTETGDLGMPVRLCVRRFHPADDDLHGLIGQRVEHLRQLEDLMKLHFLLLSHINEANQDPEEEAVPSVWDRQELHPAGGNTVP